MSGSHTHDEFIPVYALITAIGKSLIQKRIISKQEIVSELQALVNGSTNQTTIAEILDIINTVGNW